MIIATTPVNLTDEEVRLFILFQKHRKFFEVMDAADGFSIKGGSVTVHFDNNGAVGSVDVQRRYRIIP